MINSKIFKEYDIRGAYPSELNEASAFALGLAFAKTTKARKIVIGRDARPESEKIFWPLVSALAVAGVKVYDLGVCATPELFFAVGHKKFPAGCMVTASHSPAGETGFKFCDSDGVVLGLKTGLKKLEAQADKELKSLQDVKEFKTDKNNVDFISIAADYKKFALSFVKASNLKNLRIVLDASSGSGARLAEAVFNALPIKKSLVNFNRRDRLAHGPNPLLPENQKAIIKRVVAEKADFGVIFDGDADRAIFFDEAGKLVEPYYINCLLSEIVLQARKGLTVTIDARLNLALNEVIKNNGGKVLRHRSGYANFIHTMSRKGLLFGCENSGHFMFNFKLKGARSFVYGDAIIPILIVADYLSRNKTSLSKIIDKFKKRYVISGELNFKTDKFEAIVKTLKKNFSKAKMDELDGLSVFDPSGDWFFNLRPSHTEPIIRLNIEAKDKGKLNQLKDEIISIIKK
jgi:phosphomannomutase